MDSLTHLVAGALAPLAFPRAPKRALLVLFGIAAGEFPDVDILFSGSPEGMMGIHRGVTHALVMQPLFALLLALLFFFLLIRRGRGGTGEEPFRPWQADGWRESLGGFGFRGLFFSGLLALCLHLYLDCMTTFGTRVFWPFSSFRVAFPAMFILDLFCTLPAFLLLWVALMHKESRTDFRRKLPASPPPRVFSDQSRRYARMGLIWLACYPLACLAVNVGTTLHVESVLQRTASEDEALPAPAARLYLLTEPFSPFVWKVVVDEGATYGMGTLDLADGNVLLGLRRFGKPASGMLDSLTSQAPIFAAFREFCPYLIVQVNREEAEFTEYAFMDLRYVVAGYSPLRLLWGRTRTNFVLEARVASSGRLLACRFLKNSEQEDVPWVNAFPDNDPSPR